MFTQQLSIKSPQRILFSVTDQEKIQVYKGLSKRGNSVRNPMQI